MSRARITAWAAAVLVMAGMATLGIARQAEGSHQPIAVAAIDTDVAGNGPSAVGTIEPCMQIPSVGQTREVDVVVESVPAEGLAGASFNLVYDPTKVKITGFDGAIMIPDAFTAFSNTVPDTDGSFRAEIVGFGPYPANDGVVARFTFQAVGAGSTAIYMTDSIFPPPQPKFIDPEGEEYPVIMVSSGQLTVGPTTCLDTTPTPSPSPTPAPTPTDWVPPVKQLNNWTWYRYPNGLSTSYWFECGSSDADCRSRWTAPYDQALADWNSRPTGARLTRISDENPAAEILIDTVDAILGNPSILGIARAYDANFDSCPATCTVRWGEVWATDDNHVGPYGTTYDRRATVAHEIGHLLALNHESVGEQCGSNGTDAIPHSLMAYDCIDPVSLGGAGENWVQDFDVCGVNQKYPSQFFGAGCLSAPTQASYFHSLPPCRLLDTRTNLGGSPGKLGPGGTLNLKVSDLCGVPPQQLVTAVVLNVTVTGPTHGGFLTVYPSDASRPLASNLNFVAGETRPNLVTVRTGLDGRVKFYNSSGQTHIIADVFGFYGPSPTNGSRYNALSPVRIMDTRNGTGGVPGKMTANQTLTFQVTGKGGVPTTGVDSVVLNMTATAPTASGFLTAYPADLVSRPDVSNLNFVPGQTVANLVTVKLSPDGKIKIFNLSGATHVIIDVAGWYTTGPSGQLFHAVTPARALDTRVGTGGRTGKVGAITDETPLRLNSVGGLPPAGVAAVVVNSTVTGPTQSSYLTLWPADVPRPGVSNLNYESGQTVPNAAILRVSPDGRIEAANFVGQTHVIIDVAGWFGP